MVWSSLVGGALDVCVGFLRIVTDLRRGVASTVLEVGGAIEILWPRQEVRSGDGLLRTLDGGGVTSWTEESSWRSSSRVVSS